MRSDSYDGMQEYFDRIKQTPLLTREEEIKLSKKVRKGDEKAREAMIHANLRLVIKIASDYFHTDMAIGFEDIVSEGTIGLMRAVEKFDPKHKVKFSTYAIFWIKQRIHRVISNHSRTIRLPVHICQSLGSLRKNRDEMEVETGQTPDDAMLATRMKISVTRLKNLKSTLPNTISMDAPAGEDDRTIGDALEDKTQEPPDIKLFKKDDSKRLRKCIAMLDERSQVVLTRRFGLDGNNKVQLEIIGKEYGVTRERIRQIERDALRELRGLLSKKLSRIAA